MKIAPIRSSETYDDTLRRASSLMSKTDARSLDELEVLQALIERWERSQFELPRVTAIDAIRFRMVQQRLLPRDLEPYIGSRARVSEVLSGSRPLSIDMIRALNRHLGIPAASLIAPPAPPPLRKRQQPSLAAIQKLRSFGVMKGRETIDQFIDRILPSDWQAALLRKTRTERTNAKTDLAALDAWCAAVIAKADAIKIPARKSKAVDAAWGVELARLSVHPDGPARVPRLLKTFGIGFVVLEHLPGTYLDGAALRRTDGRPVIAVTLRYDRLDNFWFTVLHEFCHVARHLSANRPVICDDLEVKTSDDIEEEADKFAQDALIPPKIWKQCRSPDLDSEAVMAIASAAAVHPAVVAGRWQRENKDYRRFSKLLGRGEPTAQLAD